MSNRVISWLLESSEPWTRYRTLRDICDLAEDDADVKQARQAMVEHPQVRTLVRESTAWPESVLKRHNDAHHPLHKLCMLADFGLRSSDEGISPLVEMVLGHISSDGVLQSLINVAPTFGGSGVNTWGWAACDAPVLLYALAALGGTDNEQLQYAAVQLASLSEDNGWRCAVSPEMGKFHGPGRRADPCPIATLYALKALAQFPEKAESPAIKSGIEMLLGHWEQQKEKKYYLFGIGSDFRKLKYPFIWYDLLHMTWVLSLFPAAHSDVRFLQLLDVITRQADERGLFTAGSMYQAWKGWSFADKKSPSPWLNCLVIQIFKRVEQCT